jgi:uncharacterized protein YebE (UPF0316 family)
MPDLGAGLLVGPLLIAGLVLTEVALWQWRIILTARGSRALPSVLGMLGAVLQITAVSQVVTNIHDPLTVAAYALGVGGGVLAGVVVGDRFTSDSLAVNVITTDVALDARLRGCGWPVTTQLGHSEAGAVRLLLIVVHGRQRSALVADLSRFAPDAFWTIEDLRTGPVTDALLNVPA